MTWSKLDKDRTSDDHLDAVKYRAKDMYGGVKWSPAPAKEQITCEVRILTSVGTERLDADMIDELKLSPTDATNLQEVEALSIKGKLFTEQAISLCGLQLYMTLRSGESRQIDYMLDDGLRGQFIRKGKGIQYWIARRRLHYYTIKEAV